MKLARTLGAAAPNAKHAAAPPSDLFIVTGPVRPRCSYVGGVGPYGDKCEQVAAAGYQGFALGTSLSLNVTYIRIVA